MLMEGQARYELKMKAARGVRVRRCCGMQEPSAVPLDIEALERFMREHVPGVEGAVEVARHAAGYSNETFFITCGSDRWVLRRPPPGRLLPTSHDVLREWRVISALYPLGVRVPKPIVACEDPSIIETPFYLMNRVDGVVIRDSIPPPLDTPHQRRRMAEELVDTLAEIHAVDWEAAGLAGLGRPRGYLERQVRRWAEQLERTRVMTRPLGGIDEITEWLRKQLPESGSATLVHGDYKLDNVIYALEAPARLLAVLDWEMATLGDPLADVGYFLAFWSPSGTELLSDQVRLTQLDGFPSRKEMAALYEAKSGRRLQNASFYICLAMWKLAIIGEGAYALYLDGRAVNPDTARMADVVPALIEHMHEIIARGQ
jgi:aminoglycoside phosphotransferase (APT) family kinase protein